MNTTAVDHHLPPPRKRLRSAQPGSTALFVARLKRTRRRGRQHFSCGRQVADSLWLVRQWGTAEPTIHGRPDSRNGLAVFLRRSVRRGKSSRRNTKPRQLSAESTVAAETQLPQEPPFQPGQDRRSVGMMDTHEPKPLRYGSEKLGGGRRSDHHISAFSPMMTGAENTPHRSAPLN